MTSKHLISICFLVTIAACGGRADPPPADAGTGTDLSMPTDASRDDAATGEDASSPDAATGDAGEVPDMCAPLCPKPAPGCTVEPSGDPCVCPTIRCNDGGMGAKLGDACGGRAGACEAGLFCNFTADFDCGEADGMGVCEMRPEICSRIFMPVCGCDGNDYSNACEAQRAGADVRSDGMCAPPDCRVSGCPTGQSCQACRGPMGGTFVCIPDGAVC
jgi:hypothetical protein